MYFWQFHNYLRLENGRTIDLNKLEFPTPKETLCHVWLILTQWFWRRSFIKFVNVFSKFRNYLPLEKGGAVHLNKLEFPSPKDDCANFGWNLPSGSGEENFKNLWIYFRFFLIISPWKRVRPFIWTNLNPLHPRTLCQVLLKMAQWFWRRRWKCEKFTTKTTMDNGQILIRKAHFSLPLRWANKVHTYKVYVRVNWQLLHQIIVCIEYTPHVMLPSIYKLFSQIHLS